MPRKAESLNVNTIDGVKIWFEDKSAILIRPSGTEPVYRLYAEAKTEEKASKLAREYSWTLGRIIHSLES
jgi:phosphomannomutase/phosphoglucomutase